MQKFINALIARLEESVALPKMERMEARVGKKQTQGFGFGVRSSVEIVNQLAEEHKDIDCSKCSRRSWYQKGYADAKKKLAEEYNNDVCEWKEDEKFNWFFKSPHEGVGIVKEESGLFNFCPYCGKKIKVVEQYGKG